jgi:pSer/pThr/pTyr-binding forkhead associated (FHA) protein
MNPMHRVRVNLRGQVQTERDVDRELLVGRKPPADLVVPDTEVSSKHLRIRPEGDRLFVTDLGSTNGTTVDGGPKLAPNVETAVVAGQKVQVGSATLEFVEITQAKPESSPGFASTERTVAIGGGAMQSMLVNVARFKAAQPRLVVAAEHDKRVVPIEEMDVVVGRDAKQAKIAIQHQSISSKHARLRFENGRFLLEDLKSVNGTFVDGNPLVVPTPIQGEQALTFGTVDCLFVQKPAEGGSAEPDSLAKALCDHAVRLGKATVQQAKEVYAEHRASGTSLGELFVVRGILGPKEWSEIYRQRQIIGTLAPLAGKGGMSFSKAVGIVVVVLGLLALGVWFLVLNKG